MLNNHDAKKYETSYQGQFVITQSCSNDTVPLQYVLKNIRHNIRQIKPDTSDTSIEDINIEKYS